MVRLLYQDEIESGFYFAMVTEGKANNYIGSCIGGSKNDVISNGPKEALGGVQG